MTIKIYKLRASQQIPSLKAQDLTFSLTYDIAGATVEDNTLWGGKCILFDSGPSWPSPTTRRSRTPIGSPSRAWINTLSWPGRAVVCRKEGSYILYNFSGGFSWYLFGPENRLQYDVAGTLGNGAWGYMSAPTTRTRAPTISVSISMARVSRR